MLGLLLARGGVDVTVMEKHADFMRDFRGDTVHASTLRLLDELSLADDFARMPHREIDTLNMKIQGTRSHRPKPNSGFPQKHCAGSTVGPRRAAGRPAQPAAALVRAVADRRRGARHVTGRRGRDQPGRRRRSGSRRHIGRPATPRHRLHQAVGSCAGAAMVARRADLVRAAGNPHAGHCGRRFGRSAR